MYISTNLLKRFISLDVDPQDLMSTLTLHTAEIEQVIKRAIDDLVVIGYVNKLEKHPDADKLVVCQVDCGDQGVFQICTAADNIQEGIFVPVALPGSYLEAIDLKIWERTMRGVASSGMICAKVELWIDEDADKHGIWILDEDFKDLTIEDLWQSLAVKFPFLENIILDVDNKTINNRPDLTGLLGFAIELKALFSDKAGCIKNQNLKPFLQEHTPARTLEILQHAKPLDRSIHVETDKCDVYSLLQIDNISIGQTSFFERLSLIDSWLISKNNRVDFSNLFMILTWQPVHIFDADKVSGDVVIRQAQEGETFVDLLSQKHTLSAEDVVIADDNWLLALAWVIGGQDSAVSPVTKNILIEIGHFDPVALRRTSMRIGVRTDAVMRFEKAPSGLLALTSLSMILDFLDQYKTMLWSYDLKWAHSEYASELSAQAHNPTSIAFDIDRFAKLVFWRDGAWDADKQMVSNYLSGIGFEYNKTWEVSVPWRRSTQDIEIEEDLYEEVARLYGYDKIEEFTSSSPMTFIDFHPLVKASRALEQVLTENFNADQLQTYPRASVSSLELFEYDLKELVALRNPTAPEQKYLRPSMLLNLLEYASKNIKLYDEFVIYDSWQTRDKTEEFSRFLTKQSFETTKLGIVSVQKTPTDWSKDGLLSLKSFLEVSIEKLWLSGKISYSQTQRNYAHPTKQWTILFAPDSTKKSVELGWIGQYHPLVLQDLKIDDTTQVVWLELEIETLAKLMGSWSEFEYAGPEYLTKQDQIVTRDVNFILDRSMSQDSIVWLIDNIPEIIAYKVIDLYTGDRLGANKKSIVYSLSIRGDGSWKTEQFSQVVDKLTQQAQKLDINIG